MRRHLDRMPDTLTRPGAGIPARPARRIAFGLGVTGRAAQQRANPRPAPPRGERVWRRHRRRACETLTLSLQRSRAVRIRPHRATVRRHAPPYRDAVCGRPMSAHHVVRLVLAEVIPLLAVVGHDRPRGRRRSMPSSADRSDRDRLRRRQAHAGLRL